MIYLVTGNEGKLKEFNMILGENKLKLKDLDLEEIQSLSIENIAKDKAKKAFDIIKEPVIIEDTGLYLEDLNGLPGPFIKFFQKQLGNEAAIKLLSNSRNRNAYAKTIICYYDGIEFKIFEGIMEGEITKELSDAKNIAFGFDYCFIPKEYDETIAMLGIKIKNEISHRAKAIIKLKEFLDNFN